MSAGILETSITPGKGDVNEQGAVLPKVEDGAFFTPEHSGPGYLGTVDLQGEVLRVRVTGAGRVSVRERVRVGERATRGRIVGFSRRSRHRMQENVARMDFAEECARGRAKFVTVTYPKDYPAGRACKRDLEALRKRLERRFPGCWGPWRCAPQERGAPHFHFILGKIDWLPLGWLREAWGAIIGHEGPERLQVDVQGLDNARHVRRYVSKYIAKVNDVAPTGTDAPPPQAAEAGSEGAAVLLDTVPYSPAGDAGEGWLGRSWGIVGKDFVVWAEQIVFTLPLGTWFYRLKRGMRRLWSGLNKERYQGGMVYGSENGLGRLVAWAVAG